MSNDTVVIILKQTKSFYNKILIINTIFSNVKTS